MLATEQGLTELPEGAAAFKAMIKKAEFQINQQNTKNILDTFVLLANSEKLQKQMADINLDMII